MAVAIRACVNLIALSLAVTMASEPAAARTPS
jgi:hypothetical protein